MFGLAKKRRRRRRRTPQRRYVYLMERVSNRDWKSIRQGRREIKIGIAKDTQQRRRTVDLGIPGRVVILDEYKVDKASSVEAYLHKLFKDRNFTVRGAKAGSGKTEFFRLTNREIRQAKRILRRRSTRSGAVFVKIVIWSVILTYLLHYITQ